MTGIKPSPVDCLNKSGNRLATNGGRLGDLLEQSPCGRYSRSRSTTERSKVSHVWHLSLERAAKAESR